jgi:hypothetical protein
MINSGKIQYDLKKCSIMTFLKKRKIYGKESVINEKEYDDFKKR